MLFKCLLVVLAITSTIPTQSEGQVVDNLEQWGAIVERVLEIYRRINELKGVDVAAVVGELDSIDQMVKLLNFFMENYSDQMSEEGVCLLTIALNNDAKTIDQIRELIKETRYNNQLQQEREQLIAECESFDTSSVLGVIGQLNCNIKLQQVELKIINSDAKLRILLFGLRDVLPQAVSCIRSDIN